MARQFKVRRLFADFNHDAISSSKKFERSNERSILSINAERLDSMWAGK
jgi:hypothetical protein